MASMRVKLWFYDSPDPVTISHYGLFSVMNDPSIRVLNLNFKTVPREFSGAILPERLMVIDILNCPKGMNKIADEAFINRSITRCSLPKGFEEIGARAFMNCRNMREVTLSEGVRSIGDGAFMNCRWLETIYLPKSVKEISEDAFQGCADVLEAAKSNGCLRTLCFHAPKGSYAEEYAKKHGFVCLPTKTSFWSRF